MVSETESAYYSYCEYIYYSKILWNSIYL